MRDITGHTRPIDGLVHGLWYSFAIMVLFLMGIYGFLIAAT